MTPLEYKATIDIGKILMSAQAQLDPIVAAQESKPPAELSSTNDRVLAAHQAIRDAASLLHTVRVSHKINEDLSTSDYPPPFARYRRIAPI